MEQPSIIRTLRCFSDTNTLTFTQLAYALGLQPDLSAYYLRKLVGTKLVEKIDRGSYRITAKGKSILARQPDAAHQQNSPRGIVLIVSASGDMPGVITRDLQPFIGITEWPARRIFAGERLSDAAKRVASEKFKVDVSPTFHGVFRRIDMYDDMVFDDKIFMVHTVAFDSDFQLPEGAAVQFLEPTAFASLQHPAKSLYDIRSFTQQSIPYLECIYPVTDDDLFVD